MSALNNRLTVWHTKEEWKLSLPFEILKKLMEVKVVKNKFYHYRHEENRIKLYEMTRNARKKIGVYKTKPMQRFSLYPLKNIIINLTIYFRSACH